MDVVLKENGRCRFALSAERSCLFAEAEVTAPYIDMLFGTDKVRGEFRKASLFAEEGPPALVGLTQDPASMSALRRIEKDRWIIDLVDGKLVIAGWFDNATAQAVRHFAQLMTGENVTLSLPIVGRMEGYCLDIPDCPFGTFAGGMDGDRGTVLLRYTGVTAGDALAYGSLLLEAGFRLEQENEIAQNRFAVYCRGDTAAHLSFRDSSAELRLVTDRADRMLPWQPQPEDALVRPSLSMLNLYNHYADGNDIGMCLIFTLHDGSFLIYDGGNTHDAAQLYKALSARNRRSDGRIVIAAWILTHDHRDHTGAFAALAEMPEAASVCLEAVLCQSAADSYLWRSRFDPYHWAVGPAVDFGQERIEALASSFGGQTRILRPHMGQRFPIRNAVVEVLYAGGEDLYPALVDNFNDTSLVTRVMLGGQTVLVLADAAGDASGRNLVPLFGESLDCDILQVSHHGLGGICPEVYPLMQPGVALWPTTQKTIDRNDLFHRNHNLGLLDRVKQTLVADSVMQTLYLPYDPDRDLPEIEEIGQYDNMEAAVMIIPRVNNAEVLTCGFTLPTDLTLSADRYADRAAKLLPLLLPQCSVTVAEEGIIRAVPDPALAPEAYTLSAELGRIRVSFRDYLGLRNGLAALSQLVRVSDGALTVPGVKIGDRPAVSHRGVMLDIARGVKDFDQFRSEMVLMAKARMNVLHIHINDGQGFGVRLESLPEAVCWENAYTREQVAQIVELADILGLELIPEIDMPAHGNKLLTVLPQLRCSVDPETHPSPWTVCPGKETVFDLFEKVIREVCELFPGRYFHMGGDELDFADAPKINQLCYWDECPDCKKRMEAEGLADRSELYYYFVKRVHSVVTACGRRLVMWSDQVDGDKQELLPKDILMQFWRTAGRGRGPAHSCSMQELLERGYQVINSRYQDTYIDVESYLSEEKLRQWRWDLRPECDPELSGGIVGTELCCWEYGNEGMYPHYWASLPSGIFLMADKLWNGDALPESLEYAEALTRAVLGAAVPEGFNIWPCFGSLIPPRTNKFNIYQDAATATAKEKEAVLQVLSDRGRFAQNDFVRACAYKARLEDKPLEIPEPGVEPED